MLSAYKGFELQFKHVMHRERTRLRAYGPLPLPTVPHHALMPDHAPPCLTMPYRALPCPAVPRRGLAGLGRARMGWAKLGWARLGWAQLGWARLGWEAVDRPGAHLFRAGAAGSGQSLCCISFGFGATCRER